MERGRVVFLTGINLLAVGLMCFVSFRECGAMLHLLASARQIPGIARWMLYIWGIALILPLFITAALLAVMEQRR